MSIEVPQEAILEGPHVNWKHIDGPLLSWAGLMHWLTWVERWRLHYGLDTIETGTIYLSEHDG